MRRIVALGKTTSGTLDYVTAWFINAGEYVQKGKARIGFVSTNSITQGEQVGQFWPILFDRYKLEIAFAHRTFAWGSDARGKAHIHVVILGLDRRDNARAEKRLFSYSDIKRDPNESRHAHISPYLSDAGKLGDPQLTVTEENNPINGMRKLVFGTQPLEDRNLTFSTDEKNEFIECELDSAQYFRPFLGAREFLRHEERWILHTADIPPRILSKLPMIRERLRKVREFRAKSKRKATKRLAEYPTAYGVTVVPETPFLVIPRVSSERREYAPLGWLEPPVIPSEATLLLQSATLVDFALLTSAMHMAWLRHVGGRLESRYRYSIGLVYNTFPTPPGFLDGNVDNSKLETLAQAILDARATHPKSTLANLYDPDLMPPNLRRAHQVLDRAIDRLYRRGRFASERERVEHLLLLYEKMRVPLQAGKKGKSWQRRERRSVRKKAKS